MFLYAHQQDNQQTIDVRLRVAIVPQVKKQ